MVFMVLVLGTLVLRANPDTSAGVSRAGHLSIEWAEFILSLSLHLLTHFDVTPRLGYFSDLLVRSLWKESQNSPWRLFSLPSRLGEGCRTVGVQLLSGGNALCATVAKSPDKSLEPSMLHSEAGKWSCGDIYLFRHILICGESRGYK